MANIVSLIANDGSTFEFYDEIKVQGSVKDVYYSTDNSHAVAFYRKPLGIDEMEKLIYMFNVKKAILDSDNGYWKQFFAWPTKIVEWDGRTGIVIPFYNKKFFFSGVEDSCPFIKNGQEKLMCWFSSAKMYNSFLPSNQKGDFLNHLRICLNIARGIRRIHTSGMVHYDLSLDRVLVDPLSGDVCFANNDILGIPGKIMPCVLSIPGLTAPELVPIQMHLDDETRKKMPNKQTDCFTLAVLIYQILLKRHPFDGGKVWDIDDPQKDDDMRYGSHALFIERPTDKTNRVKADQLAKSQLPQGDPAKMPYSICGPYLKELFDKAFIDGVHNPSARPSALQWEEALVKTCDLVQPCQNPKCEAHWYVFDNTTKPRCPFCGTEYKGQLPILNFYYAPSHGKYISERYRLMVYDKQTLYRWHSNNLIAANEKTTADDKKPVGDFHFYNGQWILINRRLTDMYDATDKKPIPIGQFVPLTEGRHILLDKSQGGRLVVVQLVKN